MPCSARPLSPLALSSAAVLVDDEAPCLPHPITVEGLMQVYGYDRQKAEHILAVLEGQEAGGRRGEDG